MKPYHKLIAWQEANNFVLMLYKHTQQFPKEELYGITSQLRRASVSVPTNLVEGYSKGGAKEWLRFIRIARASLTECEYLLELSLELKYLDIDQYQELEGLRARTSFLINKLYKSITKPL